MADGNDCPECGENIGMRAVLRAPLPNRIYCPHCKTRLRYGSTGWLIAAAVVLTVLLVLFAGGVGLVLFREIESVGLSVVATVVLFVVGCHLLEMAFVTLLWYGDYRLEPVNRLPAYDNEDYEF